MKIKIKINLNLHIYFDSIKKEKSNLFVSLDNGENAL